MNFRTSGAWAAAAFVAAGMLATVGAGTADAGKTTNPFAGQYTGPLPDNGTGGDWGSISISSDGRIVITQAPTGYSDGRFTGSVQADGTFELLTSWNINKTRWWVKDAVPARADATGETAGSAARVPAKLQAGTIHYVFASGTLSLGGDKNLYGISSYGNQFVWTRQ